MDIMMLSKAAQATEKVNDVVDKGADAAKKSSLADILLIARVGVLTGFVVLVVLMLIITLISKIFSEKKPKKAEPAPVPAEQKPAAADERVDTYTGVKLIGVSDKDAALIMAIVADGLDKPLDNLRFISIKEVK